MGNDVDDLERHFGLVSLSLAEDSDGGKVATHYSSSRQQAAALRGLALVASATPGVQTMPVEKNAMLSNRAMPSISGLAEDTTSGTRHSREVWPRVNMKYDIRRRQEASQWTVKQPTLIVASHDNPSIPSRAPSSTSCPISPHCSRLWSRTDRAISCLSRPPMTLQEISLHLLLCSFEKENAFI